MSGSPQRLVLPAVPTVGFGVQLGAGVPFVVAAGYLGNSALAVTNGASAPSDYWLLQASLFVNIATLSGRGWASRRLWLMVAALLGGFIVGGLLAGAGLLVLGWFAVANLIGVVAGVALFRRDPDRSWVATDLDDYLMLWLACLVAPLVTLALGGFPRIHPGSGAEAATYVWCALRQFAILGAGATSFLPLYFAPAASHLPPLRARWWPAFVIGSAACLGLAYSYPELPLSWLVALPAVVAGAVMTMRAAAVSALTVGGMALVVAYPQFPVAPLLGLLLPQAVFDVVVAFIVFLALLIVVLRERDAALLRRHRDLAHAQRRHRALRDGVLETMAAGLLLTDRDGRVLLSNGALTYLLGDVPPSVVSWSWSRAVDLQTADVDRLLSAPEFARLARPRAGGVQRSGLVVPGGPTGSRRLAVTTHDVTVGAEDLTLWLLRDVTAVHERERELEEFAGAVAHQLKEPLTSLDAWMATADRELAEDDAEAGRDAMERAHQAIGWMRELIDDYLAQAVGAGATLSPADVPLREVVDEVSATYQAVGGLRLVVEAPDVVHADPALLRQLFANLIGRGVRGATGAPTVAVRSQPAREPAANPDEPRPDDVARSGDAACSGDAKRWVEVEVTDGPGGGGAAVGRVAGSGVPAGGLIMTLCEAIVRRHGGRLHAAAHGDGVTIRFTLPAATGAPR